MQFPVLSTNLSAVIDHHVTIVDLISLTYSLVKAAQGQPHPVLLGQPSIAGDEFAGGQGFGQCQRLLTIFSHKVAAFWQEDELEGLERKRS